MTHKVVLSNGGVEGDRDKTMGRSVIAAQGHNQSAMGIRKESAPLLHNSGSCARELNSGGRMSNSMTTTSSSGPKILNGGGESANSPLMRSVSEGSSKAAAVANGNGSTVTANSLDGCCSLKTATATN